MVRPCLDVSADNGIVHKFTGTWVSHADSERARFKWELRGLKKTEASPTTRHLMTQKAMSFFKTRS